MRPCLIIFFFYFSSIILSAQKPFFSLATDLGIQRSFKKDQRYWAVGHTVNAHFHVTQKQGIYAGFAYFSPGNYKNFLTASAKSPGTNPQQIAYQNDAIMRFKQLSIGWKQYLRGGSELKDWGLYGTAGFGLMLGRIENSHSPNIDTSQYNIPVHSGKANFKRLTLDLAVGYEVQMGADISLYTEGRAFIPTTDYPSNFLFVNDNAPFMASFVAGMRFLF